jgi:hypothetical protein
VIDVCQLCHSPIRSDVFTSFIDEASGLQSAFTVYYGFDPDLFWAAMIVYAVNVAGRLVLGLLAVVNVDWAEVQLVDGRAWRRVPGLLLMLIEPVSGNKLLESTLVAKPVRDPSVTVLRCQIYVGPAGLRPQCRDEIWVWGLAESEGLRAACRRGRARLVVVGNGGWERVVAARGRCRDAKVQTPSLRMIAHDVGRRKGGGALDVEATPCSARVLLTC